LGTTAIFQKTVGGVQEETAVEGVRTANATYPNDVSGDGRFLLFEQASPRGYDIGVLTVSGERKSSTFVKRQEKLTPFRH
jgi:hypothetical protein